MFIMSSETQITQKQDSENTKILEKQSFEQMQELLFKASQRGSPYLEVFQLSNQFLRETLKQSPENKQQAFLYVIKKMGPQARAELVAELKREKQKKDLIFESKQNTSVPTGKAFDLKLGEGPIDSHKVYEDFGIGKKPNENESINKIEMTSEQKKIYSDVEKKLEEIHKGLGRDPPTFRDCLHATAGVLKIMRDENKTKEESMQIVEDLTTIFGIRNFGRYSAKNLVEQHNNTIINPETGEYSLKVDGNKEQILFMRAHHENKGVPYSMDGISKENRINRQINETKKSGQVWIYESDTVSDFFYKLEDFNKDVGKNYTLMLSGHGNTGEIVLGDGKSERLTPGNIKLYEDVLKNLNLDKVVLNACSEKSNNGQINKNRIAMTFNELTNKPVYAAQAPVYDLVSIEGKPAFYYGVNVYGENVYGVNVYTTNFIEAYESGNKKELTLQATEKY